MFLVVGLGNPGNEYRDTRHNVGFMAVDRLASRAGIELADKKWKALYGRCQLGGAECVLMKPQPYMNLSGESVGPAFGFYKLTTAQVIVIHDDLDFELGRIKLKVGGGHGGHNGLRSLKAHLPDDGFIRVRLGIGRPPPEWDPADYVLGKFAKSEHAQRDRMLEEAEEVVLSIIQLGIQKAMGLYNRSAAVAGDGKTKREGS
ncbi:MAG: aminoacyl-tRNA hydrolase [Deltaproteobacteria bacterium]|jgi:PTH1 family peptidyl-tRNA hydrolase|nr:aminoacyl-tRNA hydrolase [Deltaproteobacteria bacterium]